MYVAFKLFLVVCLCSLASSNISELLSHVSHGLEVLFNTGKPSADLAKSLNKCHLQDLFKLGIQNLANKELVCPLCNKIASLLITKRKLGIPRQLLVAELIFICAGLGLTSERVCKGAIELNIDTFLYIFDNYSNVTASNLCGLVFQSKECSKNEHFEWEIEIPEKTLETKSKPKDVNSFKILHFTDLHYNPQYTVNRNPNCGEPLCCQKDQKTEIRKGKKCGYWTDYKSADIPWYMIENFVKQIKTHKFDYAIFTGDIVDHRVWDTSIEKNSNAISKVLSYLKENIDVPLFPLIGNHEAHPINVWPPKHLNEQFPIQWLFDLIAEPWSQLVGEDIKDTVKKGGYYTVSPKPGLRIIAINNNVCYIYNWWLLVDNEDPYGQLQWLVKTLEEAEKNGESVHILSHIPTGSSDCLSTWAREYGKIISRFSNTITGQFNGHTHTDEFQVFYNKSDEPVGVVFNGASVTPFESANPSYKIFEIGQNSFTLLDFEEWTFNLSLANAQPDKEIEWYKLYSFCETYGTSSLEAIEVDTVIYRMAMNFTLLDEYNRFKFRNLEPEVRQGCNRDCKMENLCQVATATYGDQSHCYRFLKLCNEQ